MCHFANKIEIAAVSTKNIFTSKKQSEEHSSWLDKVPFVTSAGNL